MWVPAITAITCLLHWLEAHLRVSQIDAWLFKNLDKMKNYFYLVYVISSSQKNSTARSTHIEKPILI